MSFEHVGAVDAVCDGDCGWTAGPFIDEDDARQALTDNSADPWFITPDRVLCPECRHEASA